jgi:hypothetical protein
MSEKESVTQELLRLGIPRTVYNSRRGLGMSHDEAIQDSLGRKRRRPRRGNAIDQSMSNTSEINNALRNWKR